MFCLVTMDGTLLFDSLSVGYDTVDVRPDLDGSEISAFYGAD